MAPIASTLLSHQNGVSDAARARELYKYYQPVSEVNQDECFPEPAVAPTLADVLSSPSPNPTGPNVDSSVTSSKISSPDTALTAFCQLVTWRTGAQRAMISVIDSATQYFIAESTKTLDLVDNTKHSPGDELWMGCGSVTKAGRLCERTIAVEPTSNGDYPSFVVTDLSMDERFDQLPFVSGPPFLRLYAGVPLITKRGIPIGSLFIVDNRLWHDGVSRHDINFMGTMARTIMKHLEMTREVEEHRRGMKMSRGLASFVEGRSQLAEADVDAEDGGEGATIVGQFETESGIHRSKSVKSSASHTRSKPASVSSIERKEKEYSASLFKTEQAILSPNDLSPHAEVPHVRPPLESESQQQSFGTSASVASPPIDRLENVITPDDISEASTMKILFSRASNLIREAFEVDGGAVFYDGQRGFNDLQQKPATTNILPHDDSQPTSGDDLASSGEIYSEQEDTSPRISTEPKSDSPSLGEGMFSRSSTESKKAVEILGFSTAQASSIHGDEYPGPHAFVPFDEKALHTLLSRYPRGKLWTFDSDGAVASSSDEDSKRKKRVLLQQSRDLLRRQKRSARAKSDAKFLARHFPGVRQLLFVPLWDAGRSRWLSGCCVWSTEPTRILSKQSELSFLSAFGNSVMAECSRIDTEIADQKKGDFIGSISHELRSPLHGILASAEFLDDENLTGFERGLVETIDSCGRTLLDTINHILDFSKINHFEKNWRRTRRGGHRPVPRSTNSALALRQSDLPMINLFADVDISTVCEEVVESTFDIVPTARGKMASSRNFVTASSLAAEHAKHPDVAVILDVDVQNYHFTTQPGAFRRVIMNLLGNALKYTSHGYVRVTLEVAEIDDLQTPGTGDAVPRSMVTLSVIDTGKGISSDFLRSKLFTPFAQENSLSSGTGLGLSIVRSIVNLLEGEITIDSEVGRGTQVRVALPLLRDMPKHPDSSSSTPGRSVSSGTRDVDESIDKLRNQIIGKRVALFGFDLDTPDAIVQQSSQILKESVTKFLVNWYGLQVPTSRLLLQNQSKRLIILVLCSHSSRFDRSMSESETKRNVGFVAKPVGPLKLARALLQCLDGEPPLATPGLLEPTSATGESSNLSGEVLDNSRMAADSENARKAIESPTPNAIVEKSKEFPFPIADRPQLHSQPPCPLTWRLWRHGEIRDKPTSPKPELHSPRLLLVDDNKINLTLLRTYMRKRKYDTVDEAENGLEAVTKFAELREGYDIIFMDISMPVLDGFGATRQIRAIERARAKAISSTQQSSLTMEGGKAPALVIALTGLASSRDQNEAFTSGIDLFLTKPVAFKEVGKLLDNWEANRERDARAEGGVET
ncbi:hypothetical protein B0O99DRAFT_649305 [Bisporella sp. PMI_857]|nr:hypothetical protein B0O99DRAFT_649305 [Bisporella sp. PMI_857]